jgi:hypothetical protein
MAWQDVKDQFSIEDIGAPLLANLAKGIYTPEAVLREYVQNAGDAYLDLEEVLKRQLTATDKQIDIYLQDGDTLAIQDSGIGMGLEDIRHYKRIALSPKMAKDRAGFRGIGIWAGFSACDQLQVETTKRGDPNRYRLTMMFGDMRKHVHENMNVKQLLEGRFHIKVETAPPADHYTQVRLIGLHDEFRDLLQPEELERIARQILPCRIDPAFKHAGEIAERLKALDGYQELAIKIKDVEIFRRFPANTTEPSFEMLTHNGEDYAFAWYCASPTRNSFKAPDASNFRLRVHNIGVGAPGVYSAEDGSPWGVRNTVSSPELLDWYVGEIHVVHANVKPNTPRSELELDADSRRAIAAIRDFYEDRVTYRRAVSDVNSHVTQVLETTLQIAAGGQFDEKEVQRLLKQLKKFDTLSKQRKVVQEKDVERRKILKQREAKDADIAKNRREAIEYLEKLAAESTAARGKKGRSKAKNTPPPPDSGGQSSAGVGVDYEQLLSELLAVVEKQLGDQEELAATLGEAIEEVFAKYGLLVPA